MSGNMQDIALIGFAFVAGLVVAGSPSLLAKLKSLGRPSGGLSLPPAAVDAAGGRDGSFGIIADIFIKYLQHTHAERTGTFVPSDVQRGDIEKLAAELLQKKLTELAKNLTSPAVPAPAPVE